MAEGARFKPGAIVRVKGCQGPDMLLLGEARGVYADAGEPAYRCLWVDHRFERTGTVDVPGALLDRVRKAPGPGEDPHRLHEPPS